MVWHRKFELKAEAMVPKTEKIRILPHAIMHCFGRKNEQIPKFQCTFHILLREMCIGSNYSDESERRDTIPFFKKIC